MPELEEEMGRLPEAAPGEYLEVEPEVARRLRGITGLAPVPSPGEGGPGLGEVRSELADGAASRSGVWVWELRLSNP